MIIKDYMSNSRHAALAFLLTMILLSFGTLPTTAGTDCELMCGSSLVNEIHTKPADLAASLCPRPKAGFCACPRSGCDTLTVNFIDYSIGYIDTWHWDFGDGHTSDEESPIHFYDTPGYYTVTLTVTGPGGTSSKTETDYIVIRTSPTADFEFTIRSGCLPATVDFKDLSTYALYWHWDFGDGSNSLEQNPSHTYTAAGTYTVKLKVMNFCGLDYKVREVIITADTKPIADFTTDITEGCEGATVSFTDQSMYADTREWNFGDGTTSADQNPTHSYSSSGTYTVSLTVTNECGQDTETKLEYITILPGPMADFEYDISEECNDGTATFTDKSINASSWFWDFGDGASSTDQSPIHVYSASGIYTVSLMVTNECGEDTEHRDINILIGNAPVADFTANNTIGCIGYPIDFTDLSTDATSWHWDFGDGATSANKNPTHAYGADGSYTISLVVSNACGDDTEVKELYVTILGSPTPDFTADETVICSGETVNFTDLSSNADSWYWDFGDGGNSSEQNPSHTYTSPGSFTVILTVTNECGQDGIQRTNYITVGIPPIADFEVNHWQVCANQSVDFYDRSSDATSWSWDFGDGSTSSDQNPTHSYAVPGYCTVSLTASNRCGSDNETRQNYIYVVEYPVADFHASTTETCVGHEIGFIDDSQNAVEWYWEFGDGITSTDGPITSHLYAQPGVFTVRLTVKNGCGDDTKTREQYIIVKNGPTADFTLEASGNCAPMNVNFYDQSTNADSWYWDFGDGATSNEQHPYHTYRYPGYYTVTLLVSNECGDDEMRRVDIIYVESGPLAGFTVEHSIFCVNQDIEFLNTSQSATSWFWEFGDGATSTDYSPTHQYGASGYYTVSQTAFNDCGDDKETKVEFIYITPSPIAEFSYNPGEGCEPLTVEFTSQSQYADGQHWDFGDGTTSNDYDPTHTYTAPGTYTVSLSVGNLCGSDLETKTDIITVFPKPIPDFTSDKRYICAGETVIFTDLSQHADSWEWHFGDGATSTEQHPSHTYNTPGGYDVTLVVTNDCGTEFESRMYYIGVDPHPVADFEADYREGCGGLYVSFTNLSVDATNYHWDFGDGTTSNADSPEHNYNTAGVYTVSLTASNSCGNDTETKIEYIRVHPMPHADFRTDVTMVCTTEPVSFIDLSTHADSWHWDFEDGNYSSDQNPIHTYASPGKYDVSLTVSNGCGDDVEYRAAYITVIAPPYADFGAEITEGCVGETIYLYNLSQNAKSVSWDFGDGTQSDQYDAQHSYPVAGNYTIRLTVSNECGTDFMEKMEYITIYPKPDANFSSDVNQICTGGTVMFNDESLYAETWSWNFGDGTTSSDQNPTHSYTVAGTYDVILTVTNECGDDIETKLEYITVSLPPEADFTVEVNNVCTGDDVYFMDRSANADAWYWDFGDGGTSSGQNPNPQHTYTSPGVYTVTLRVTNGCGEDTETKIEYITVGEGPLAEFTSDKTETCANTSIAFTDLSTRADTWSWNFGDGMTSSAQNPIHTYSSPGTYTVALTVTNDCGSRAETKTEFITVSPDPIADFESEIRNVCAGAEVYFIDMSQHATNWLWNFGDGTTSTDQQPSHSYTVGGAFTVSLTVSNACGDDTETKEEFVTVTPAPIADFNTEVNEGCLGETVYFYNVSQHADSYLWNFGDGTTSQDVNPMHTYSAAGVYTISLTAYNICGDDTETKVNYVTVYAGPMTDFSATPTSGSAPMAVNFTDLSTSYLTINSWSWNFGDGSSSIHQNPVHTYTSPGTYTVSLTVTDDCGNDTETKIEYVNVIDTCAVDFFAEPTEGCVETVVYFNGNSIGDCNIVAWLWNFGDPASGGQNTASGQIVQHRYRLDGSYTVTMTAVNDQDSIVVTKSDFITIHGGPNADFEATPTTGTAPLLVNFTDMSTSELSIYFWEWNFGDPASGDNTSLLQNPSHSYTADGTYNVSLIVNNECGVDTAYGEIIVTPSISVIKSVDKPFARMGDDLLYTVTIRNNSQDIAGNILVIDTIPDSTGYIVGSISGNGVYNPNLDMVSWYIPYVSPGAEETVSFMVNLDGPFTAFPTIVSNQAIAYIDAVDTKGANATTYYSNIVETEVDQTTGDDLGIVKDVSATQASRGDELTYTITITNGRDVANNVTIFDAIPDFTAYVNGSISIGGNYSSSTDSLVWSLGTLNPFQSRMVSFRVIIDTNIVDNIKITNTALVQSSLGGNQSNEVITTVSMVPIVITKTTSTPSGMIGDLMRFTIKVQNFTDELFTDVQLTDTMPNGIFYIGGTSLLDGSLTNDPTGDNPYIWALGDLPASGTLTLEYTGLVSASAQPGVHENVARAQALQDEIPIYSNRAVARVYILSHNLSGSIRGRVIVDCDGDGVADMDSIPSPMDIYLDDGSHSQSNEQGMFYFSTVRPGERVVMLDERDLDGYYVPDGVQSSVFAHVHETGESYILFRICPDYAHLNIEKKASIVPTIKLTKTANLNPEQKSDSLGVLIDYEIDIKSNGLADPTRVRVVDSFPESMNLIVDESRELVPREDGNKLTYEVTAAQERMQKSIFYSLRDLEPGMRQFLTNKVFLEGDIERTGQAVETVNSEPIEVAVGPFLLAPPQDVQITLTPALFITSKADLLEPAFHQLEAAADSIMKYADADIKVEGHCDYRKINTPEFPSNWELGEARAKAVVDWLVVNRKIDSDRLSYESFAATRPIVEGVHTSELLQPNRRTEVIIKTGIGGFMDPGAIPAGGWSKTTTMSLNPIAFDTVFEASQAMLETGLDDTWEVILTIENTSAIAAENSTLTDIIPNGAEFIDNSSTMNGNDIAVTVNGQKLSIPIERIDPSQRMELRYRIRAIEGASPSGGGAASIEVRTANDQPVIQSSNEVRFK
ncbi:MAG: PKD domain-containing protein [Candidatus Zixiibacteriota bacterium]